ncbi:MAG: hypothetical protein M1836_008166 [Candelina mexicana]|nr:MAG: hypothetical protein M1836_008166 [Candelina mexicana]
MSQFPDAAAYWDHVRRKIQRMAGASGDSIRPLEGIVLTPTGPVFPNGRAITTLLLLGESAADKRFLEVLREALQGYEGAQETLEAVIDFDPLHVAARGATEIAKRYQEAP